MYKPNTLLPKNAKQTTNAILMVRPTDFGFNPETALDNEFQHRDKQFNKGAVLSEFEIAVALLRAEGITVLVLEKTPGSATTPDAVFPNNWFATNAAGVVTLFPMFAPNRRAEKAQYQAVESLLFDNGFQITNIVNIGAYNEDALFLEGTGSLIIDHPNQVVYAALSVRTDQAQLENYFNLFQYQTLVTFHTASTTGKAFYHTNVVMSLGDGFAVICPEAIPDLGERFQVLKSIQSSRTLIELSLAQTEQHFCANILAFSKPDGSQLIVMSETAKAGFTSEQLGILSGFGQILALPIATIEHIGGGSARCMMAEIFLPRK